MKEVKKTLVLGASDNPARYSYLAINRLRSHGHPVVGIGRKNTKVADVFIEKEKIPVNDIDTVTLYLNPKHQENRKHDKKPSRPTPPAEPDLTRRRPPTSPLTFVL